MTSSVNNTDNQPPNTAILPSGNSADELEDNDQLILQINKNEALHISTKNTSNNTYKVKNTPRTIRQKAYKEYGKSSVAKSRLLKKREKSQTRENKRRIQKWQKMFGKKNYNSYYEYFVDFLSYITGNQNRSIDSKSIVLSLNPRHFIEALVITIQCFIGTNQTISIAKFTSNYSMEHMKRLHITHVQMIIPYFAPKVINQTRIVGNTAEEEAEFDEKMRIKKENERRMDEEESDSDSSSYGWHMDSDSSDNDAMELERTRSRERQREREARDRDEEEEQENTIEENKKRSRKAQWEIMKNAFMSESTEIASLNLEKSHMPEEEISFLDHKPTVSFNVLYGFAVLDDRRLLPAKCNPYILNEHYQWMILNNVFVIPPPLSMVSSSPRNIATSNSSSMSSSDPLQKIIAAVLISDGHKNICVYATKTGLYYNHPITKIAMRVSSETKIQAIWRQGGECYVLIEGPKLLSIKPMEYDFGVILNEIFYTSEVYTNYMDAGFVGAYFHKSKYNQQQILFIASQTYQIFAFHNRGLMDHQFYQRIEEYRNSSLKIMEVIKSESEIRMESEVRMDINVDENDSKEENYFGLPYLEMSLCFYGCIDRNSLVYITQQNIVEISLDLDEDGLYLPVKKFGKMFDTKQKLRGVIKSGRSLWMYIYHQKTLAILRRVNSRYQKPYILHVFTENSLIFDDDS